MHKLFFLSFSIFAFLLWPFSSQAQVRAGFHYIHNSPGKALKDRGLSDADGIGLELWIPDIQLSSQLNLQIGYRLVTGKHRISKKAMYYQDDRYTLDHTRNRMHTGVVRLVGPQKWSLKPYLEGSAGLSVMMTEGTRHENHGYGRAACPSDYIEIDRSQEVTYGLGTGVLFQSSPNLSFDIGLINMFGPTSPFIELNSLEVRNPRSFAYQTSPVQRNSWMIKLGINVAIVEPEVDEEAQAARQAARIEARRARRIYWQSYDSSDDSDDDWFESSWDNDSSDAGSSSSGSSGSSGSGCGGG